MLDAYEPISASHIILLESLANPIVQSPRSESGKQVLFQPHPIISLRRAYLSLAKNYIGECHPVHTLEFDSIPLLSPPARLDPGGLPSHVLSSAEQDLIA